MKDKSINIEEVSKEILGDQMSKMMEKVAMAGGTVIEPEAKNAWSEWTRMACEFVLANLQIKMTRSRLAPVQTYYEKIENGLEAIRSIDELRYRKLSESMTKTIALLEQLIKETPRYRFLLRYELKSKLAGARTIEQVVINTAPPEGWQIVKRPKEETKPLMKKA